MEDLCRIPVQSSFVIYNPMLTLKQLRDDPEYVIRKLAVKNFDARAIVEKVIALDDNRKALQTESDALLSQQKKAAAEIGALMKQG